MDKTTEKAKPRRLRLKKYFLILSALTLVSALLYWEQTALLYVISTLLLTGLLLVVAFSDLGVSETQSTEPAKTVTEAGRNVTNGASPGAAARRDHQAKENSLKEVL